MIEFPALPQKNEGDYLVEGWLVKDLIYLSGVYIMSWPVNLFMGD